MIKIFFDFKLFGIVWYYKVDYILLIIDVQSKFHQAPGPFRAGDLPGLAVGWGYIVIKERLTYPRKTVAAQQNVANNCRLFCTTVAAKIAPCPTVIRAGCGPIFISIIR